LGAADDYRDLDKYLEYHGVKHILLVCGRSFEKMLFKKHLDMLCQQGLRITRFSDFKPNPVYESVVAGVKCFRDSKAETILAVGGGSALDVAKCIKLYKSKLPHEEHSVNEGSQKNPSLIAVPTTAGTGSEATRYAVIYRDGEKQSVTNEAMIPNAVLLDPFLLISLPPYHRKAAMLDALCHGIESFWSVNSTEKSRIFSEKAIEGVLRNLDSFLENDPDGNAGMLVAAHMAGKAINITQTTAGHAMAYKLTSLYGIAHGHAVALCVAVLWPWMLAHIPACIDPKGEDYLKNSFERLAELFGADDVFSGADTFQNLLERLELKNIDISAEEIPLLARTVNTLRLKNHPVRVGTEDMKDLYSVIRKKCMRSNEG